MSRLRVDHAADDEWPAAAPRDHHRPSPEHSYQGPKRFQAGVRRRPRAASAAHGIGRHRPCRSEEHTSELQSLMRISYAVFCLKKKRPQNNCTNSTNTNSTKPTREPP